MTTQPTTRTFMEYEELDLYDSWWSVVEVPHRDPARLDFKKVFESRRLAPTAFGYPLEFRFFDANVVDGEITHRRNESKTYIVAELVMSVEDYKKREEPKLALYKKEKTGFCGRVMGELLDGGGNLKQAFKSAFDFGRPVMDWYIKSVGAILREAEATGATHVHLWGNHECTTAKIVAKDDIILNSKMQQLYPLQAPARQQTPPRP